MKGTEDTSASSFDREFRFRSFFHDQTVPFILKPEISRSILQAKMKLWNAAREKSKRRGNVNQKNARMRGMRAVRINGNQYTSQKGKLDEFRLEWRVQWSSMIPLPIQWFSFKFENQLQSRIHRPTKVLHRFPRDLSPDLLKIRFEFIDRHEFQSFQFCIHDTP